MPRVVWDLNCALGSDGYFGGDDVFFHSSGRSRETSPGREKFLLGGHSDVVGAADAGFEHAAAPDGDGIFGAEIVDAFGRCRWPPTPSEARRLIDFCMRQKGGGFGLFVGVDALIS